MNTTTDGNIIDLSRNDRDIYMKLWKLLSFLYNVRLDVPMAST